MKFLHISDLHIGKYVNGYRMLDDQRYMLKRIVEIIKEKNLQIVSQKMEMDCEIEISIRKKSVQNLLDTFESLYEIKLTEI